MLDDKNVEYWP